MTASQREQHEIIISVLQQDAGDNFTECARRPPPNRASIVYSSTAGLPALAEVFGDSAAVILEESELQQWRDHVLDPAHDPARAWHQESWWKLHRPHWTNEFAVRLTDARQLWVMESGRLTQGSGGGHEDHWLWDGTRAEFLKRRSMWLT
ncbi:MAG: hypothetical protein JNG89_12060 [Planctomycetaceae bacterium]|nr:hypothetical protein [Planctomycetaceae bacterium]